MDILLIRNGNFIKTKVYRKPTNNDIYLNGKSFAPNTWKRSTLRTLIKRAHLIFSTEKDLVDELKHLEYVFEKYNNFPKWVIDQLLSEGQSEDSNIRSSIQENQNDVNKTLHILALSYAGSKGEKLIKSMKNSLKCVLPENVTTRVAYSQTRLSSKFTNMKAKTLKEHHNDIVYFVKCSESQCSEDYTGQTARRLSERVLDHNGRDAKYHLVKHAIKKCHKYSKIEDFNIIGKSYRNNTFKRKVAESLLIKYIRPTLNTHEKSVREILFN